MTKPILFEKLSYVHAEIVAGLHEDGFEEKWSAKQFQNLITLPASFGFIASQEGQPIGFILCQGDEVEAEVITISTSRDYRCQGVATELLNLALKISGVMFLEVARDNPTAISFYQKNGFSEVGVRKAYYKRANHIKVDALVLKNFL